MDDSDERVIIAHRQAFEKALCKVYTAATATSAACRLTTSTTTDQHPHAHPPDVSARFEGIYRHDVKPWQDGRGGLEAVSAQLDDVCQKAGIGIGIRSGMEHVKPSTSSNNNSNSRTSRSSSTTSSNNNEEETSQNQNQNQNQVVNPTTEAHGHGHGSLDYTFSDEEEGE
ncbi:MAG: hypothetical protein M1837_002120 [Sclerophora amabilis]|nr:MAG: hypothetical protein M1837_002120 [Sclerophora amabilis]